MLAEAQKRAASTARSAAAGAPEDIIKNGESSTSANTTTNSQIRSTQPPISATDLTLILQFPPSTSLPSDRDSLQSHLSSQYGPINHVFIKDPPSTEAAGKKKKPKGRKAIVEFKEGNWGGCWACWRDCGGEGQSAGGGATVLGLEGVKVKWAGGSTPDWVAWSETQRPSQAQAPVAPAPIPNMPPQPIPTGPTQPKFSSAPDFGRTTMSDLLASHNQNRTDERDRKRKEEEFESMTILRMRQMERERLAEQIRREEDGVA